MICNIHLVCNISLCWWFGKNNPCLHSVTCGSTTSRFGTANKLYLTPACGPIRGQQTPRQRCGPIRGQHIASSCRSRSGAAVLLGANKLCVHQSRQTWASTHCSVVDIPHVGEGIQIVCTTKPQFYHCFKLVLVLLFTLDIVGEGT